MIFLATYSILILYFSLTICGLRYSDYHTDWTVDILIFSPPLRFMPNAFEDFSSLCQKEGKVAKFLDIEKPAVYVRSSDIVDQI